MALIPCRECQREISSEAPTCPHCGAPSPVPPLIPRPDVAAATHRPLLSLRAVALCIIFGLLGLVIVVTAIYKKAPVKNPTDSARAQPVPPAQVVTPEVQAAREDAPRSAFCPESQYWNEDKGQCVKAEEASCRWTGEGIARHRSCPPGPRWIKKGSSVVVWRHSTYGEALKLRHARADRNLLLPYMTCVAPGGSRVAMLDQFTEGNLILVLDGEAKGCRGLVEHGTLAYP